MEELSSQLACSITPRSHMKNRRKSCDSRRVIRRRATLSVRRLLEGTCAPFGPIVFLIGPGKTEVGQAGAEVSNQFHKKRNTVQSPILGLWPSCDRMLKEFRLLDSQADDAVTARSCAVSEQ